MTCVSALDRSGGIFDYDARKEELEEIIRELEQPDVWNNPEQAQKLGQDRVRLEKIVLVLEQLESGLNDACLLYTSDAADDDTIV